mmetsp:Transcript_23476/g.23133  ORF Transcript_23476/g.23133 Transcript_23476/m.23133 type:complete len:265 (+) Transcript_23476:242-1036(+)
MALLLGVVLSPGLGSHNLIYHLVNVELRPLLADLLGSFLGLLLLLLFLGLLDIPCSLVQVPENISLSLVRRIGIIRVLAPLLVLAQQLLLSHLHYFSDLVFEGGVEDFEDLGLGERVLVWLLRSPQHLLNPIPEDYIQSSIVQLEVLSQVLLVVFQLHQAVHLGDHDWDGWDDIDGPVLGAQHEVLHHGNHLLSELLIEPQHRHAGLQHPLLDVLKHLLILLIVGLFYALEKDHVRDSEELTGGIPHDIQSAKEPIHRSSLPSS